MLVYEYPGFTRFEMILRNISSIKGSAKQIISRLEKRIQNVWKKWPNLWTLTKPVFETTVYLGDLGLSDTNLFRLSQPLNQWTVKYL